MNIALSFLVAAVSLHLLFFGIVVHRANRFPQKGWRAPLYVLRENLMLHCPWSWSTSVRARVAHLRGIICVHGRKHETLGIITRADLDNTARHEEFARHCFISRTRFWLGAAANFARVAVLLVLITLLVGVFRGGI